MRPENIVALFGLYALVYAIAYYRGTLAGRRDNGVLTTLRESIHSHHNRGFAARLNIDACDFAACKEARKIAFMERG